MSKQRFCRVCGGWHDPQNWPHNCMTFNQNRSGLSAPMLIQDNMEPVQSMLDGKMYDSKAALRATYKEAGVVEVGNDSSVVDPKPRPKPEADHEGVKAAVGKAFSRAGLGA